MSSSLFDTHAHLPVSLAERTAIIERALKNHVVKICDIATSKEELEASLNFHTGPRAAAIHPHEVKKEHEAYKAAIEDAVEQKTLHAIGETGLDYHYAKPLEQEQKELLRYHMLLAYKHKLPLIIHCREAFSDFLALFDAMKAECHYSFPGILHCFTGTKEEAKEVLDRGLYVSISGIVTYPSANALREVVAYLPLDRLLIETDSPFLAPQGYRGQKNEPAYVVEVCKTCALLRGISFEKMAEVTFENGSAILG